MTNKITTNKITMKTHPVGQGAFVTFERPGRVEFFVADGKLHAHIYDGSDVDLDQDPLFAYDGTLPHNHDCEA
jgi:hypothetical protein